MYISSRTPEGDPAHCAICGAESLLEPSYPAGDTICPNCGALLWTLRDLVSKHTEISPTALTLETNIDDLGQDSLEIVELVMELEEAFGVNIPDDIAERFQSVGDLLRFLREAKRKQDEE